MIFKIGCGGGCKIKIIVKGGGFYVIDYVEFFELLKSFFKIVIVDWGMFYIVGVVWLC